MSELDLCITAQESCNKLCFTDETVWDAGLLATITSATIRGSKRNDDGTYQSFLAVNVYPTLPSTGAKVCKTPKDFGIDSDEWDAGIYAFGYKVKGDATDQELPTSDVIFESTGVGAVSLFRFFVNGVWSVDYAGMSNSDIVNAINADGALQYTAELSGGGFVIIAKEAYKEVLSEAIVVSETVGATGNDTIVSSMTEYIPAQPATDITTTFKYYNICPIECCYKKLAAKVSDCSCNCEDLSNKLINLTSWMAVLDAAICCDDEQKIAKMIEKINKLCSDCGCGCSGCK